MSSKNKVARSRFQIIIVLALTVSVLTAFAAAITREALSFSDTANEQGFGIVSAIFSSEKSNAPTEKDETGESEYLAPVAPPNGLIAYERGNSSGNRIYAKDPNAMGGETALTGAAAKSFDPAYSTDGRRIVFVSERDSDGDATEIYAMNHDGTSQKRLTYTGEDKESLPAFSPDGAKIVFVISTAQPQRNIENKSGDVPETSNYNGDIYVMNSDGSNRVQLTNNQQTDNYPTFSPDGAKILFTRNGKIWQMNADGTGQAMLYNADSAQSPSYSPNGQKIVFSASNSTSVTDGNVEIGRDIFVINADPNNPNPQRVSSNAETTFDESPAFSPDGAEIVFASRRAFNNSQRKGLYLVGANGMNERLWIQGATFGENFEHPTWQFVCAASFAGEGTMRQWDNETVRQDHKTVGRWDKKNKSHRRIVSSRLSARAANRRTR